MRKILAAITAAFSVLVATPAVHAGEPASCSWGCSWSFPDPNTAQYRLNAALAQQEVKLGQVGPGSYSSTAVNIANQTNITTGAVNATDSEVTISTPVGQTLTGGNQQGATGTVSQGGDATGSTAQHQ